MTKEEEIKPEIREAGKQRSKAEEEQEEEGAGREVEDETKGRTAQGSEEQED